MRTLPSSTRQGYRTTCGERLRRRSSSAASMTVTVAVPRMSSAARVMVVDGGVWSVSGVAVPPTVRVTVVPPAGAGSSSGTVHRELAVTLGRGRCGGASVNAPGSAARVTVTA